MKACFIGLGYIGLPTAIIAANAATGKAIKKEAKKVGHAVADSAKKVEKTIKNA